MTVAKPMLKFYLNTLIPSFLCAATFAQTPPAPAKGAGQSAPKDAAAQTDVRGGNRQNGGGGGGGGRMFGPMGRSLDSVTELREQFQPAVLKRDVPLVRDELMLDAGQVTIVETLMSDYEMQFNGASEKAQETQRDMMRQMFQSFMGNGAREKFQESFQKIQTDLEQMAVESGGELPAEMRRQYFRDQMQKMSDEMQKERETSGAATETKRIASEMTQAAEKWRRERTLMDTTLMDGLKATLKTEQTSRWDAFERFLRREKSLSRGRLSGESVNLFTVVDEAALPKDSIAKLAPVLDEYEVRLDQALKNRNEYLGKNESKALKAIQESDAKAMEQLADRMIDLRSTVRNVNEESRTAIVALLSPEEGKRVDKAALSAAYGRVYRATRADRSFKAAIALEGLDPEVLKSIEELSVLYAAEIDATNQRIAQTMRKSEPDRLKQEAVRASGLLNGGTRFFDGQADDPADAMLEKRGTMTDNYVTRLTGLLTPEQAAKLPKGTGKDDGRRSGPFGSWTIADMPEDVRTAAKAADKDGNGIIEGEERREMMRGMGGQGGRGGQGGQGGQGG